MDSDQPVNPVQGSSVNPTDLCPQDVPNNPDASATPVDPNAVLLAEKNPDTTNLPPYAEHIQQPISSAPVYSNAESSSDDLGQVVAESHSTTPDQKEDGTAITQQPQEDNRQKRKCVDICCDCCVLCVALCACIGCICLSAAPVGGKCCSGAD